MEVKEENLNITCINKWEHLLILKLNSVEIVEMLLYLQYYILCVETCNLFNTSVFKLSAVQILLASSHLFCFTQLAGEWVHTKHFYPVI